MSLKPPKKGDLDKSWMSPRRDKRKLIQPEYHLIVTEGTDTEPAYFEAIKATINEKYRGRIEIDISGKGDNTVSLFKKAKKMAEDSPNQYRHVWVVFDTDDFPAEHIDEVSRLCQEASDDEEITYHAIWSNQCIELWFLLHFSYFQSDIHRSEYWPKLTKCLTAIAAGAYRKNRTDMFVILRPYMDTAIMNAKKLEENNRGKLASQAAPGTRVYELVEKLKVYL